MENTAYILLFSVEYPCLYWETQSISVFLL